MRVTNYYVKNVGAAPISLPEIGGYDLDPEAEINMTDQYGGDSDAVYRALYTLPGTVLYQQREAGNLEVRAEPVLA